MVEARPVLDRDFMPGQNLAPAGMLDPIRARVRAPWRSPVAPASIKPRGRARSCGKADSACRLRGNKGSLPLFPQDVIDPAQGRGRMGKADGAGEQDDRVVDLFRGRPGL